MMFWIKITVFLSIITLKVGSNIYLNHNSYNVHFKRRTRPFFPISPHEILVRLSAHYSQMYDHYVELKKYIPMNIHHIRISNIEICVNVILKQVYVNIMMVQSFFFLVGMVHGIIWISLNKIRFIFSLLNLIFQKGGGVPDRLSPIKQTLDARVKYNRKIHTHKFYSRKIFLWRKL